MLSLKNIGQRLLDSTTLDEKIGGAFNSATKTGISWGQKLKQNVTEPFQSRQTEQGYKPSVQLRAAASTQDFLTNKLPQVPLLGRLTEAPIKVAEGVGKIARYAIDRPGQDAEVYNSRSQADSLRTQAKIALQKGDINTSRRLSNQAYDLWQSSANKQMGYGQDALKTGIQTATGAVRTGLQALGMKALGGMTPTQLGWAVGVPTAIGGVVGTAMGDNPIKATLNAAGDVPKFAGLNRVTGPVIDPLTRAAGRAGGPIGQILGRATAGGLLNVVEDELYNYLAEGRKTNPSERLVSFGIGASFNAVQAGTQLRTVKKAWQEAMNTANPSKLYQVDPDITLFKSKQATGTPEDIAYREGFIKNTTKEKYQSLQTANKPTFRQNTIGMLTRIANVDQNVVSKMSTENIIEELQRQSKKQTPVSFDSTIDTPKLSVEPTGEIPKTVKVWNKSKFSNDGAYVDIPVIRKEENITLYQGGKDGDGRQFWTPDKKYAEQFGNVKKKTGSFYKVDNGNRVTDVYVEAKPLSVEPTNKLNYDNLLNEKIKIQTRIKTLENSGVRGDISDYKTPKGRELQKLQTDLNFTEDAMAQIRANPSLNQSTSRTPSGLIQEQSKPLSVEPVGGKVDLSQPTPINYSSKTIPIDKIKSVGTKGSYDPTSYEYSKKQLQSGKSVAPIEVRLENGKYVIEDGEHRFKAYKELGIKDIPVKVISPSPLGGKVVAQGGLSDAKPTIKGVTSTTKPQIQTQSPELQRINTQIEAPKPVVSSDSIITPAGNLPKRSGELKKQLMEAQQNLEQSQAVAEQNKLIRDNFSPEQIKDINQLKMLAKKSLDQGGDIETLRGKYPKLVESVTSHVREADQTIVGDSEALDFALSLPTKAETRVDMSEAKNLQKQLDPITKLDQAGVAATTGDKSVTSAVVEPTPKTVKGITTKQNKLDTANEVRARKKLDDEWQKAVFGEAQTRTTRQAEKKLEQAIKRSTNEATFKLDTADSWKDKNALSLGTETMDRNFEDIMEKQAPELKRKLLEPVYKSEAQRTKFLNTEREQIKKLGIKAGSKESSLVQEYGEGNITAEQLKQQTANPEKIIKASEFIRGKYDEYLGQLNKVLTRNGYEPIPKRSDYFHHFQELTGAFDLLGVSLKAQDLPTDINGLTADFKPGKTFFSAALQRLGGEYKSDAIGGIDKYLEGASNQIYHTDNIQALRSFETALREKFAGTNHLSNFVANLSEYTNGIAGKKSMIDRAAESIVGRGIYGAATGLKKQVGANMVGANVSSALTNFIPLTQTLATTDKGSVLNAIMATIKNVGKDDGFIQASDFLTTRHGTDRLAKTLYENVADKAGWLFKNVDSFVSQVVTRSKYLEGIKKGMSESSAMDYANSWAKKLMAGRGKGEMPTLFNSQTLGAITQFQLEVKNQLSFMAKDIPRNFDKVGAASAIAQLFLYGYLFNNLYEKMTGRRPAFDPIGVGQRTYEDYTNPDMKKGQATKNLVSNVSNQLPFVSTFTGGRLPITSAIPNPMAVVNGESTLKKELMKPLQFVLPTGGGQIKKSVEGISAYNKGVSTSPSGRIRFAIPQTTTNKIRTGVFGQWSTPEAQKYLREGQSVLGEKQTKQVLESGDKVAEFAKVKAKSLFDKKIDAEKEAMKAGDKKVSEIGGVYLLKQDNGDIETIDISKEITVPKYTGQTEVDKKLVSAYKGKITSRINDIVKLVEAGKIEPTKAEEMIKTLKATQSKLSGGKKPKKITIKTTKAPRVSFKLAKPTKMSVIKAPTSKRARISFKNYKPAKIKV